MVEIVRRPLKEGVGEKPTTPKPLPQGEYLKKSFQRPSEKGVDGRVKPGHDVGAGQSQT